MPLVRIGAIPTSEHRKDCAERVGAWSRVAASLLETRGCRPSPRLRNGNAELADSSATPFLREQRLVKQPSHHPESSSELLSLAAS